MAGSRLAIIVLLIIIGIYFLIDHMDPLPLNHEYIGLGKLHLAHAAFGVILIAGALYIWRMSRTPPQTAPSAPKTSAPS